MRSDGRCRRCHILYCRVELPRYSKLINIAGVNLLQRRIAHAARIVAKDWPVRLSMRFTQNKQVAQPENAEPVITFHLLS